MNNHHKQFKGSPEFLRSPERLALLEIPRVVALSMEGISPNTLLDVGAGSGVFTQAFAEKGLGVTAIDLSLRMLTYARQLMPDIPFIQARMEALPFPSETFDIIFLGQVLHETDALTQTLSQLHRCARKRVIALEWPYKEEPAGPPLHHRLRPEQVEASASRAGFSRIDVIALQRMVLYRIHRV